MKWKSAYYGRSDHRLRYVHAITKQSMQDHYTGAWSEVSIFDLPFKRAYVTGTPEAELLPYDCAKYHVLYRERKRARDCPSPPYPFLRLPCELRNQIYEELFNFDHVELAHLHATGNGNGRLRMYHMKRYKKAIVPHLCFLRVNKQVNQEAGPIFYGQNEFRFSNVYGFDTLAYFLRTIGENNTALVRKITECYPKPSSRGGVRNGGMMARSVTGWGNFEMVMTSKMGMRPGYYRFKKFTQARTQALVQLDGGLAQYRFVIAEEHDLDDDFDVVKAGSLLGRMSAEKLAGMKTQLVLLKDVDTAAQDTDPERVNRVEQIVVHVKNNGFEVVNATYDELGRYEVPE